MLSPNILACITYILTTEFRYFPLCLEKHENFSEYDRHESDGNVIRTKDLGHLMMD